MSNYQKIGLKKLLEDNDFYDMLSITHFSHKTSKYIYRTIVSYYSTYFKVPTRDVLASAIVNSLPAEKAELYVAYLKSVDNIDITNISYEEIINGLEGDLLTRTIDNNIEKLTEAAYNKNTEEMREVLADINTNLLLENKNPKDIRKAQYDKANIKYVKSWLHTMQENSVNLSGLTIIGGKSGGGKSILALQQALFSYEQGLDVVYMSLELPENEVLARLYSNVNKVPFAEALQNPKDINDWVATYFDRPNSFKILNVPVNSEELLKIIDVEAASGADVIIIDYLQLVEQVGYGDEWKHLAKLTRTLHLKAMATQTVIITPVQIDVGDVEVDATEIRVKVRGSKELENSSSLFLCIYSSPDENRDGVSRLFTVKARNGIRKTYILENKMECMAFEDSGVSM